MSNHTNPETPVASVKVWELTDPTSEQNEISVLDQDVISLGSKPFSAKRTLVSLDSIQMIIHSSTHRVRTRTKVDPKFVVFLIVAKTAQGTIDGIAFRPDILVMVAPGAEADLVVEPGYKSTSIMMTPVDLEGLVLQHGGQETVALPKKYDFKTCDGQLVQSIFSLCEKVASIAERTPKLFNENRLARVSAETDILESLVSILNTENVADENSKTETPQKYSKIIKDVEDYSMRHLDRPVFVRDLCKIAGVSERTLHGAFREIMNMPPAAYLRRLRLHRVRSDLQRGSRSATSVSTVALDWGFWHFGEFSQAYKKCFGEMPSKTLKRRSVT
jgi:AraC family ethanolamine operon transcriptional activator